MSWMIYDTLGRPSSFVLNTWRVNFLIVIKCYIVKSQCWWDSVELTINPSSDSFKQIIDWMSTFIIGTNKSCRKLVQKPSQCIRKLDENLSNILVVKL